MNLMGPETNSKQTKKLQQNSSFKTMNFDMSQEKFNVIEKNWFRMWPPKNLKIGSEDKIMFSRHFRFQIKKFETLHVFDKAQQYNLL